MSLTVEQFREVLDLLPNERPDVRRQVLQVVQSALQSDALMDYFIEHGTKEVKLLAEMVQPGEAAMQNLSLVLVMLINLSDKGACSRAMLEVRVVPRVMLLLEKGGLKKELQELCLILLNNLTSVSVEAVEMLLQLGNKALEGFYLSQLVRRFVDEHADPEELIIKPTEEDGAVGGGRDRSKWVGSILGNCAQCAPGRKLLIEDEDNIPKYAKLLRSDDPQLRLAVASLLKNLMHDPTTHGPLVQHEAAVVIMERIVNEEEKNEDIWNVLCHAVRCLSLSPVGTDYLDSCGAKKELQLLLPKLKDTTPGYAELQKVVDSLDDVQDVLAMEAPEPQPTAAPPAKPLPAESGVEELDSDEEEAPLPERVVDDQTTAAEQALEDIE